MSGPFTPPSPRPYDGIDLAGGKRSEENPKKCGVAVNKPPLGVPIGHDEYVRTQARERLREAREFLQAVPRLPDLQCVWLLLLF